MATGQVGVSFPVAILSVGRCTCRSVSCFIPLRDLYWRFSMTCMYCRRCDEHVGARIWWICYVWDYHFFTLFSRLNLLHVMEERFVDWHLLVLVIVSVLLNSGLWLQMLCAYWSWTLEYALLFHSHYCLFMISVKLWNVICFEERMVWLGAKSATGQLINSCVSTVHLINWLGIHR